ncbi:hypothetical protein TWF594_003143 [Orbilia oligospora]|nr:hypothetical protein TWF103_002747 [Orbilia oligospora]KAF3121682.1 hypothetical protein TWF594_003143 [Orbilia oligospora]
MSESGYPSLTFLSFPPLGDFLNQYLSHNNYNTTENLWKPISVLCSTSIELSTLNTTVQIGQKIKDYRSKISLA